MRLLKFRTSIFILLLASSVQAKGEKYDFVTLDFPPLEYLNKKGEPIGAAVEIVQQVMKELGHEVKITVLPWARAVAKMKLGEADAIFTAYKTADRLKFMEYSDEILINQFISLYTVADSPVIFSGDLKLLKDQVFGIVSNISYGEQFDKLRADNFLKAQRVERLELNFRKLAKKRIDIVINNKFGGDFVLKSLDLNGKIVRVEPDVESIPSYIAYSKARNLTELKNNFDKKISQMKKNGGYYKILGNHNIAPPHIPKAK